ncbi:MAG: hypothetical protein K9K64_10465 [Desulfohalobiaceae bacterium]|nr:hypothetical protein [Desulfohalobiaceae bacterium]
MDKSKTYISMCERAQEIQKLWTREHGDFFVGKKGRIECWIAGIHDHRDIRRGVGVERTAEGGLVRICRYIWLPRLDQLIEMAQVPGRRYELVTQDFHDWTRRDYGFIPGRPRRIFSSLEQAWLAFVMQQKHHKGWDGRRWVSCEP